MNIYNIRIRDIIYKKKKERKKEKKLAFSKFMPVAKIFCRPHYLLTYKTEVIKSVLIWS